MPYASALLTSPWSDKWYETLAQIFPSKTVNATMFDDNNGS